MIKHQFEANLNKIIWCLREKKIVLVNNISLYFILDNVTFLEYFF